MEILNFLIAIAALIVSIFAYKKWKKEPDLTALDNGKQIIIIYKNKEVIRIEKL